MVPSWRLLTVLSSLVLRLSAYSFLRWIPGHHFPPIILASLVAYLVSFWKTSQQTPRLEVLGEEVDIAAAVDPNEPRKEEAPLLRKDAVREDAGTEDEREPEMVLVDRLVLGERPPQVLKTLLTGLPSPTSLFWSAIAICMNVLLAIMTADLTYRAPLFFQSHDLSFVKLGYVSDSSASILIREPNRTQLPIYVSYRRDGNPASVSKERLESSETSWTSAEKIYWLSNDTDFTCPVTISALKPSTKYEFSVSNGQMGTFITAPRNGQLQPIASKFTFLTSSCIKPRFPYSPFHHPLSIPGFRHLAKWLPSLQASFMLFLGDFIYVDVPHRFGQDAESYRREYRQVYASPDWPSVSSIPWLHVIDDHEIANDWDRNTTPPYPSAVDAFNHYHASVNPPAASPGAGWYIFTQGPASFFLMDTRSYRTAEFDAPPESANKTMLGTRQLSSLLWFLSRPEPSHVHWKIVVSSIPFTRNWRVNAMDTWAGYLHERQTILGAMWDVGASSAGIGVVVLSGDRHEFAATSFPPPKDGKWPMAATVHEFSTSPLSMFYLPLRTYWEVEGQDDVCIKYIPDGNSKFGAVEIENAVGGEQSLLRYRLFVDGEESWSYGVMSPPGGGRSRRERDAVWG